MTDPDYEYWANEGKEEAEKEELQKLQRQADCERWAKENCT